MSASTSDLSAFFQHLRLNNPFDDNRITRTDVVPDSVDSIHRAAWDELLLQTQRASAGTNARSVVITGPPGIGKSHLLARFREWAVAERHPFVYLLNLQSGPRDLLRSIVRTTLQSLSRDLNRTPFQCRLFKIIHGAVTAAGQRFAPGEELSLPRAERLYLRLVDEHGLPRGPARVLWAFFEDIYRLNFNQPLSHTHQLALQWLSGDALDPEHARELQLFTATADEGVAASNEELREILQLLCRFAAFRGRCLILAFDQIDTLSEEQVRAWSAAAHGLLDLCPGLMLVCSGVDSTLFQWTQARMGEPRPAGMTAFVSSPSPSPAFTLSKLGRWCAAGFSDRWLPSPNCRTSLPPSLTIPIFLSDKSGSSRNLQTPTAHHVPI
ncbi:MAG UNVERIFIED_CONTAM: AAA family ATPase [Planctomycetaceae bacterium]|jgi:hypothetical protein